MKCKCGHTEIEHEMKKGLMPCCRRRCKCKDFQPLVLTAEEKKEKINYMWKFDRLRESNDIRRRPYKELTLYQKAQINAIKRRTQENGL